MATIFALLMVSLFGVYYAVIDYSQLSSTLQKSQQTHFMSLPQRIDCIRHKNGTIYVAMNYTIRIERLGAMYILYISLDPEMRHGKVIDIVPFSEINSIAVNLYDDKCNCSRIGIIKFERFGAGFETMYFNQFEC